MDKNAGPGRRVLEVDLTAQTFTTYNVTDEELKMYLGGKGLALKMIYDRMDACVDPLGKDNIIAFMTGPLLGTGAPCSSRFSAVTKSPLTGIMASANCGGTFGLNLKSAGWYGILIRGKAEKPVYLLVTSEGVEFRDASQLWGKDAMETQKEIAGKNGAVVIGQAGENLVRFANIVSGHRFLGRAGMGAVMGSKNLKAVLAVGGRYKISPQNKNAFEKAKKTAVKYINSSPVTSKQYRNFGTNANLKYTDRAGILPVCNFASGSHPDSHKISGEEMRENHKTRHNACRTCTILCGKKGMYGDREKPVPEYETIGLLGSNLGIFDSEKIAEWNELCNRYGMDTISTGSVIGWTMEATAKGLVKSNLKFGSPDGISEAITDIALGRGFGREMSLGVRALSEKYGGKEFAIHVKGLEMAAYDPRGSFGHGLAYAVANRGACHLSAPLAVMEVILGLLKPYSTRAKADFCKFLEDIDCCINSSSICLFTFFAFPLESPLTKYTPNFVLAPLMLNLPKVALAIIDISLYIKLWSSATGIKISRSQFLKAGERIHILERHMNNLMGISRKDDTLPERMLNEGRLNDPDKRTVPLNAMLDNYYKLRGYDSNGIPTPGLLKSLQIS